MSILASPLWNRLDAPGHDACAVEKLNGGWRVDGVAVFADKRGPAHLAYRVDCGPDWVTRRAMVSGFLGDGRVDATIIHAEGGWTLDGKAAPAVRGCLDVDFGFTPATNFQQLSREAMAVGDRRAFDVAWWEFGELIRLPQTYQRLTEATYQYDSPQGGYSAVLEMRADGFVVHYPTLWAAEDR